jgi:hypothetical protein
MAMKWPLYVIVSQVLKLKTSQLLAFQTSASNTIMNSRIVLR